MKYNTGLKWVPWGKKIVYDKDAVAVPTIFTGIPGNRFEDFEMEMWS